MSEEVKQLITDAEVDAAVKAALEKGINIEQAIAEGKKERNKLLNIHLILIAMLIIAGGFIIWGTLEDNKIATQCQIWFRDTPFYFNPNEPFSVDPLQWAGNETYREQWSEIEYKEVIE